MTMAALATVNNSDVDNQQFQAQFGSYFNMMLQMEETLLTAYEGTITALAE